MFQRHLQLLLRRASDVHVLEHGTVRHVRLVLPAVGADSLTARRPYRPPREKRPPGAAWPKQADARCWAQATRFTARRADPLSRSATLRSWATCRFNQNSGDVPNARPRRNAESAEMFRLPARMAEIRFAGTPSARASAMALKPSGSKYSSRRISTG